MSIRNLKSILVADAITATAVFAAGLLAAAPVGALLGLPTHIVAIGGWICFAAGVLMLIAAKQAVPNAGLVRLIAVGNLGWVAASFAAVAVLQGQMTPIGIAIVIAQALGVLGFAILEWKGAGAVGRVAAA